MLLSVAAAYLTVAVLVIVKGERPTGLLIVFVAGFTLGVAVVGLVAALALDAGSLSWSLVVLPAALLLLAVAVWGAVTGARFVGHPTPRLRMAVAALLGTALPTLAIVIFVGLAFTTGSTCLG